MVKSWDNVLPGFGEPYLQNSGRTGAELRLFWEAQTGSVVIQAGTLWLMIQPLWRSHHCFKLPPTLRWDERQRGTGRGVFLRMIVLFPKGLVLHKESSIQNRQSSVSFQMKPLCKCPNPYFQLHWCAVDAQNMVSLYYFPLFHSSFFSASFLFFNGPFTVLQFRIKSNIDKKSVNDK